MARRKVPMRKCIVTGEMKPKQELIRVVRSKEGVVSVDTTGKLPGRGAYLSINKETILTAKQRDLISTVFKVKVDKAIYDSLINVVNEKARN